MGCLLLCLHASAYDFEAGGIYYNKNTDGQTVAVTFKDSNYGSYTGDVVIPETVTNEGVAYAVTSIGDYAFYLCSELTSITIADGVTNIGYGSFGGCTAIKSIYLPDNIEQIGSYAFWKCQGLTSVDLGNNLKNIDECAFVFCYNLVSISIPGSVTSIGTEAFYDCRNLKEIHISDIKSWCGIQFASHYANPLYGSDGGLLYIDDAPLYEIEIPHGVTSIADYAFLNTSITDITIPASVTTIGQEAFSGCLSLKQIHISDIKSWLGIKFVSSAGNPLYSGHGLLYIDNTPLYEIEIPDGVTSISDNAFCGASITGVTIPGSVTTIGNSSFSGCENLQKVIMNEGISQINGNALSYCSKLLSIEIPASVTNITTSAFACDENLISINVNVNNQDYMSVDGVLYNKDMTILHTCPGGITGEFSIPNGVAEICFSAFNGCSLTSINIPNSVTSIGSGAFCYCSNLTSVTIPNGVELIASYTFGYCQGLKSITIGSGVKEIDMAAFSFTPLQELNILANEPPIVSGDTFYGLDQSTCKLNVPIGASGTYRAAQYWSDFNIIDEKNFSGVDNIESNENVVEIARYTTNGQLIVAPTRGLNIVRYSDGSTRKVIVE